MQAALKMFALGAVMFSVFASASQASTVTFTATRVVHVSDRSTPAQKLLKAPIRVQSEQKLVLIPRMVPCVAEYCSEQVQYTQLKLTQFQRIGSTVTRAKAHGKLAMENGINDASVEITGNTDQTARMTIQTVSADGFHKSQATLEGYFTHSVF